MARVARPLGRGSGLRGKLHVERPPPRLTEARYAASRVERSSSALRATDWACARPGGLVSHRSSLAVPHAELLSAAYVRIRPITVRNSSAVYFVRMTRPMS